MKQAWKAVVSRGNPDVDGFYSLPALVCLLALLPGCASLPTEIPACPVRGEIVLRDVIDCFDEGLMAQGNPVYCEASAVVYDPGGLTMASDKPIPGEGRSAVFTMPYPGNGAITGARTYQTAAPFLNAVKYEDMSRTPDGKHIIATTGFDRVKSESHEWDGFNTLMTWPAGKPEEVRVVAASTAGGVTSSVSLREKISRALVLPEFPEGVPYFKVESVAAIPGDQLLFGIRELGVHYEQFAYSFKIIAVSYQIEDGELLFTSEFELVYDFDTESSFEGRQTTALSSIEYDPRHDRLYILTSYENEETDEGLGGYLWTLSLTDLANGEAPSLVTRASGDPLLFAHKAEGVTVLDASTLLVIHDDDKVLGRDIVENPETQFSRKAHQAAYSVVSVGSAGAADRRCDPGR